MVDPGVPDAARRRLLSGEIAARMLRAARQRAHDFQERHVALKTLSVIEALPFGYHGSRLAPARLRRACNEDFRTRRASMRHGIAEPPGESRDDDLVIGHGLLGPNSPISFLRDLNAWGVLGWYYEHLYSLADGKEPDRSLSAFKALLRYDRIEGRTARAVTERT
ncbi:MAG: hypothetical protein QM674_13385 [Burkholderiaceae bacterium]